MAGCPARSRRKAERQDERNVESPQGGSELLLHAERKISESHVRKIIRRRESQFRLRCDAESYQRLGSVEVADDIRESVFKYRFALGKAGRPSAARQRMNPGQADSKA